MSRNLARRQAGIQAAIVEKSELDLPGLDVYRSAYRLRMKEALAADYPVLCRWLGKTRFDDLADKYLEAYPSRHFSIRWFGCHLAEYLYCHGPLEWAEMAEFEWALSLTFDCADSKSLEPEVLAKIPPQDWPRLKFTVTPGLSLLTLRPTVPVIWKALQAREAPPECFVLPDPVRWMVWRLDLRSFFRSMSEAEAQCLSLLQSGTEFAEICANLSDDDLPTSAAHQIALWLRRWLEEGVIIDLQLDCGGDAETA